MSNEDKEETIDDEEEEEELGVENDIEDNEDDDSLKNEYDDEIINEEDSDKEIEQELPKDCIYRFNKKKDKKFLFKKEDLFVKPEDRITKPYITIYENTRLISERATHIARGAKPLIKNCKNKDPKLIARLEVRDKVCPLNIIRPLPNGKKERWYINELENFHITI